MRKVPTKLKCYIFPTNEMRISVLTYEYRIADKPILMIEVTTSLPITSYNDKINIIILSVDGALENSWPFFCL